MAQRRTNPTDRVVIAQTDIDGHQVDIARYSVGAKYFIEPATSDRTIVPVAVAASIFIEHGGIWYPGKNGADKFDKAVLDSVLASD